MTDTYQPTESLNHGKIISDAFTLVFRNIGTIGLAALIPMAVSGVVQVALMGLESMDSATAITDPTRYETMTTGLSVAAMVISGLIGVAATLFLAGAVTRAAIDQISHGEANLSVAMAAGIRHLLPVLLIMLVVSVLGYLGAILLIVPGLYVFAMWWVALPSVVDEQRGFSALGRSFELTREYRWPMIGLLLIYILIYLGVSMLAIVPQFVFIALGTAGLALAAILNVVVWSFAYALGFVIAVLAYYRLREIKEGGGPGVADVFS